MQGQPTDTSHTVTITLPLTPYQPEELLIISTVQPSNPIMANFSRPGMQYSVTFDDLMAGTSYTFTVRIVLRANTTVDVVQAAIGLFMTLMTPSKLVYAPLCKHNLYTLCILIQQPLLPPLPWLLPAPPLKHPPLQLVPLRVESAVVAVLLESSLVF